MMSAVSSWKANFESDMMIALTKEAEMALTDAGLSLCRSIYGKMHAQEQSRVLNNWKDAIQQEYMLFERQDLNAELTGTGLRVMRYGSQHFIFVKGV